MKKISMLVLVFALLSLLGCNKGSEVSGRSMRSAYRSVNYIKSRLSTEMRIEFEMSFWMLKDEIKDQSDFLDEVGGSSAEELIELGKALYQKRKNEGYKNYDQFDNWDQMISHYAQERLDQNKRKKKTDTRDTGNSVIYDL
ncbi:MAG: hypothetical protein Q9M50_09350 [Methylococcales bacterium]|nr:hypothetical protein [Methylococcales bacterium]